MPFTVTYLQDIPKDCSACPCSTHITTEEVYCHALNKHIMVEENKLPNECSIIDKPLNRICENWITNNKE